MKTILMKIGAVLGHVGRMILPLIVMLFAFAAVGDEYYDGKYWWMYEVAEGKAKLTRVSCLNPFGDLTILSQLGGYPVTSIGRGAFGNCSTLTSVTIPSGVLAIGDSAFYGCEKLASVTLPASVQSIGEKAFMFCPELAEIRFPESSGVLSLGGWAFLECPRLGSVDKLIQNLGSIAGYTFKGCSSIKSIEFPPGIKIGYDAFSGCSALTSIRFQPGDQLYKNSFFGCSTLRNVNLPDDMTIYPTTFAKCASLTELSIGPENKLYSIRNGLVCNKEGTKVIYCPTGLSSVTIPETVTELQEESFYGCDRLSEINIPAGVVKIGAWVFADCDKFMTFTVDSANPKFCVWNGLLCTYDHRKVVRCPSGCTSATIPANITDIDVGAFGMCTKLRSVSVPDSVTNIWDAAFEECSSLESITIPPGVTKLCDLALSECTSLAAVSLPDTLACIGYNVFFQCTSLKELTIPENVSSIGSSDFSSNWPATIQTLTFRGEPPDGLSNCGMGKSVRIRYRAEKAAAWVRPLAELGFVGEPYYSYKINFDKGTGRGTVMNALYCEVDKVCQLPPHGFMAPVRSYFTGWICKENGRFYDKNMLIFGLGKSGDEFTFTAQWRGMD